MKNIHGKNELNPFSLHIAITKRVQKEDLVRWARTPEPELRIVRPLKCQERKNQIKRFLTSFLP